MIPGGCPSRFKVSPAPSTASGSRSRAPPNLPTCPVRPRPENRRSGSLRARPGADWWARIPSHPNRRADASPAVCAGMGMDWHSSGITTSVIGALKRGLAPLQSELGIHVCGGRGKHSRRTPEELTTPGERIGIDGLTLTRASRLVAKVDSAAVQDGFDLYLHGFFVTDEGKWTVVQQGMNGDKRQARRYHWHSESLKSFVDEPHSAIDGPAQG